MSHHGQGSITVYSPEEEEKMKEKARISKLCIEHLTPYMVGEHIRNQSLERQTQWIGALGRILDHLMPDLRKTIEEEKNNHE